MRNSSSNKWFGALLLAVLVMVFMPGMAYGAGDLVAADAGGGSKLISLWKSTGIYGFFNGWWQEGMMIMIGILLIYLGIAKKFEPLLLIPIGFGCILANIPFAGIADGATGNQQAGFLHMIFEVGIKTGIFPLLIFMGVGAMTDFGPLFGKPENGPARCSRPTGYLHHIDREPSGCPVHLKASISQSRTRVR